MKLEVKDRGLDLQPIHIQLVERLLKASLDQHETHVGRVRVRLMPAGRRGGVVCRLRAWCATGPTVVVSTDKSTIAQAVSEAADVVQEVIRRRIGRGATRRRWPAMRPGALPRLESAEGDQP
jgi:hypothetical protein